MKKEIEMKIRYIRVSTLNQKIERQLLKAHPDEIVFIDKVSGSVPFALRPVGSKLLKEIEFRDITSINVSSIDRLGRNTIDILKTIDYLHSKKICLEVDNLGLKSWANGKENLTFKLIISVLANISEMERESILERQQEGIRIAKAKGIYKGRERGSSETKKDFLSKYPNVIQYLQKKNRHTITDIAKLCDCSKNTVMKVKKYLEEEGKN
ncbi:recombinase family protein [Flavobacterium sp. C4GT6]|uniref:recombinase family protein n=1 Tax=Flavobacterium sp. C4GT6 TaxID=3103818 RepID=UPI002ED52000